MSSSSIIDNENINNLMSNITDYGKTHANVCNKAIESKERITLSIYKTYDNYVDTLCKEINKPDVTFEQKQYYIEEIKEAMKKKDDMGKEHSRYLTKIIGICSPFCCYLPFFLFLKVSSNIPKANFIAKNI